MAASLAALESRRAEVNDLNVFPVADGDTGDNMAMTLRAVLDELDGLGEEPLDVLGREELVSAVARAALLGARGNSGVILSQIVRGAAELLASRPGELIDPKLVAAALASAADAAYDSVRDPAEGTMLTAVRAMAEQLDHMQTPSLGPEASPAEQDALLAQVLERALDAANEAVNKGPEQLAVLKEAGVVDAGAYGLTVIVAGVVAALRGADTPELAPQAPPAHSLHLPQHESSSFRYCTNFAVTGTGLDGTVHVEPLEQIGDSVLVVGDDRTLRVHIHTDDPDAAMALFRGAGELSRVDIADMVEQVADRSARLTEPRPAMAATTKCSVVAVATGAGLTRLFQELGVLVVDGGPTMNPSTHELLAAVHSAASDDVLLLPNSNNVTMAAQRAAELSDKPVALVPTTAPQEGLAALLAFDPARSCEENATAVSDAAAALRCGGVAESAREDPQGRFSRGDAVGYSATELVAWGEPAETLRTTLAHVAAGAELVTCIAGQGAPLPRESVEAAVPDGVELELHEGGQPAWWWLLCAE